MPSWQRYTRPSAYPLRPARRDHLLRSALIDPAGHLAITHMSTIVDTESVIAGDLHTQGNTWLSHTHGVRIGVILSSPLRPSPPTN